MQNFSSFQEFYYRGMSVLDKIFSAGGRDVKHSYVGLDSDVKTEEFSLNKEDVDKYKRQFKLFVTDLFIIDKTGPVDTDMFIDDLCNNEGAIDPDKLLYVLNKYSTMPVSSVSRQIGLADAAYTVECDSVSSECALDKALNLGNCFRIGNEFLALTCTDKGLILNSNYSADVPLSGRDINTLKCNVPAENISLHIDPGKNLEFNTINIQNDIRDSRITIYTGKDVFLRGVFSRCSINSASNITEACHKCVLDMNYGDAFSNNVKQVMQSDAVFSKGVVSGVVLDSSKGECDKDALYERLKKSYDLEDQDILDLAPERGLELEYVKDLSPEVTPVNDKKQALEEAWGFDMGSLGNDDREEDLDFEV